MPPWFINENPDLSDEELSKIWCKQPLRKFADVTDAELVDRFEYRAKQFPGCNWAIVTRESNGLACLDADTPKGLALLRRLYRDTPPVITGRGGHIWARDPEGLITGPSAGSHIDMRGGKNSFGIAPGSIHHTGRVYQTEDGEPLGDFHDWPEVTAEALVAIQELNRTPTTLETVAGTNGVRVVGGQSIAEGRRNAWLTEQGGRLRWAGLDEPEIYDKLTKLNTDRCVPPLEDSEVQSVARSVSRYATAEQNGGYVPSISTNSLLGPLVQPERFSRVEFVDVTETFNDIEPPDEIIEGILEADSLAQMFGKSGDGKTFVAADMARAIAWNQQWHGRDVMAGPVLYLCGESPKGLRRRFMAAAMTHGEAVPSRLFVSEVAAPLATLEGAQAVHAAVEAIVAKLNGELPVAIFIDTLARNYGGDENSSEDMAAFVQHLDDYLRRPYRAAVVVVHHTGHGDQSRGRGSSVWKAALDTEIKVSRPTEALRGTVELHFTKTKEIEPPPDIELQIITQELASSNGEPLLRKNGEPLTAGALVPLINTDSLVPGSSKKSKEKLGANQRTALDALLELYTEEREKFVDDDRDPERAFILLADWQAAAKLSKQRFADVKKTLAERHLIEIDGDQIKAIL